MIILNRGDKQYTDIEKFKKYELSYCIAYEMGIRNDEVIKTIENFIYNYITYDRFLEVPILDTDSFQKCDNDAQKLMNLFFNPFDLYLKYHFFNNINQKIKSIETKKRIEINPISRILHQEETNYYSKEEISKDNNMFHEYRTTSLFRSLISHEEKEEDGTRIVHHNDIEPNYSRPFSPPFKDIKERRVILNLALPTNELIEFIKDFKKVYDKEQNIVKNIHELFTNRESKHIDLPNIQSNYADMLFSYDCHKLGFKTSSIVTKINNYRLDELDFKSIKETTVKKYIAHGHKYIDEQYYKHLVT